MKNLTEFINEKLTWPKGVSDREKIVLYNLGQMRFVENF